jgi:hypothetical protein
MRWMTPGAAVQAGRAGAIAYDHFGVVRWTCHSHQRTEEVLVSEKI